MSLGGRVPQTPFSQFKHQEGESTMITVAHVKSKAPAGSISVHVGRPRILGNPFPMSRAATAVREDEIRKEVIAKYRVWLWARIKEQGEEYKELVRIKDLHKSGKHVRLTCFCHPKACHADVIKRAVEWMAAQE